MPAGERGPDHANAVEVRLHRRILQELQHEFARGDGYCVAQHIRQTTEACCGSRRVGPRVMLGASTRAAHDCRTGMDDGALHHSSLGDYSGFIRPGHPAAVGVCGVPEGDDLLDPWVGAIAATSRPGRRCDVGGSPDLSWGRASDLTHQRGPAIRRRELFSQPRCLVLGAMKGIVLATVACFMTAVACCAFSRAEERMSFSSSAARPWFNSKRLPGRGGHR